MKKFLLLIAAAAFICAPAAAQTEEDIATGSASGLNDDGSIQKYRRSSLYSVLIKHSKFPYGQEINDAFMSIPTPDKFNNHDAGPKAFESSSKKMKKSGKKKTKANTSDIAKFIKANDIPRQMIAKWFNRDEQNGAFDLDLMFERGLYDAQQVDIEAAKASSRNIQVLADAGEELIGKTFLLVNDITFVDRGERAAIAGAILKGLGSIAAIATGVSSAQDLGNSVGDAVNDIDGFCVNITSYLYRLDWSPEVAETFWSKYWIDDSALDSARKEDFEKSNLFKLTYIGETTTQAANLASKSMASKSKADQMLKVCTRAIDKSIVMLQREYDEFRVNVPIGRINPDNKTVEVAIGLKEGLNERSIYDVLMKVQNEDGTYTYDKVGKIRPAKGKIWDNRFGALEDAKAIAEEGLKRQKDGEGRGNASLTSSQFRIIEGANRIVPGCLIREATIKRTKK